MVVIDFLKHFGVLRNEVEVEIESIFVYEKDSHKVATNRVKKEYKDKIVNWLEKKDSGLELAEDIYYIILNKSIFVFNKFEDEVGIVLTGCFLVKNMNISIMLLQIQERYHTKLLNDELKVN